MAFNWNNLLHPFVNQEQFDANLAAQESIAQAQIDLINHENELKYSPELQAQKNKTYVIFGIIIVVIVIGIIVYIRLRNK